MFNSKKYISERTWLIQKRLKMAKRTYGSIHQNCWCNYVKWKLLKNSIEIQNYGGMHTMNYDENNLKCNTEHQSVFFSKYITNGSNTQSRSYLYCRCITRLWPGETKVLQCIAHVKKYYFFIFSHLHDQLF